MDITALEEKVAHLIAAVDDLSAVVARQDRVIDRLDQAVRMLTAREAQGPGSDEADVRPPHW